MRVWIKAGRTQPEWSKPVGDAYVAYQNGETDRWATRGNCMEPKLGPADIVAWIVCEEAGEGKLALYREMPVPPSLRVFRRGKVLATIRGAKPFIEESRFVDGGAGVVIKSRAAHGPATIERCETNGGKVLETVMAFDSDLPAWAKGFAE